MDDSAACSGLEPTCTPSHLPFPVVGLGASAGGLAALPLLAGVAITVLASLAPMRSATRVAPLQALRTQVMDRIDPRAAAHEDLGLGEGALHGPQELVRRAEDVDHWHVVRQDDRLPGAGAALVRGGARVVGDRVEGAQVGVV